LAFFPSPSGLFPVTGSVRYFEVEKCLSWNNVDVLIKGCEDCVPLPREMEMCFLIRSGESSRDRLFVVSWTFARVRDKSDRCI
jgi:hypothetical protein